jgi:hypothetical protein
MVNLMRNTTMPIPTSVFREITCSLVPESVPLNCNLLFNIKLCIVQLTEPPPALLVPTDLDFQPAQSTQNATRYVRQLLQVTPFKIFPKSFQPINSKFPYAQLLVLADHFPHEHLSVLAPSKTGSLDDDHEGCYFS